MNSRKALVELRATKEAPLRAVFHSPVFRSRPTNPFFSPFLRELERRSYVSRFAGAGKRGNEFSRENARDNGYILRGARFPSWRPKNDACHPLTRDISYFTLIPTRETLSYSTDKPCCASLISHVKFYASLRCMTNSMDTKKYPMSLEIFENIHIMCISNIFKLKLKIYTLNII